MTASARIRPPPGRRITSLGQRIDPGFEFEHALADGRLADLGYPSNQSDASMPEQPGLGRQRQTPLTLVQMREQNVEPSRQPGADLVGYAHTKFNEIISVKQRVVS
ncbi:hypothetical protein [Streptomyces aureoversilis]|uniref:Uncharacterized protein n=1 Tax=Streptomyces aureoversilis TaxID=67277 RepID=A0ABW0AB97_9ACTN